MAQFKFDFHQTLEQPVFIVWSCTDVAAVVCVLFRAIYEWNTVTGKQTRIFRPPSRRHMFSSFATDAARANLYAIDRQGRLFVWNLTNDQNARCEQSSELRHNTARNGPDESSVTVVPPTTSVTLNFKAVAAEGFDEFDVTRTEYVDNGLMIHFGYPPIVCHVHLMTNELQQLVERSGLLTSDFRLIDSRHVLLRKHTMVDTLETRLTLFDSKTRSKRLLDTAEVADVFTERQTAIVRHAATGALLGFDSEAEVLHVWQPVQRRLHSVNTEVGSS